MENINVSIFASAVRPLMWESCLSSFLSTSCNFEVIFGGFCTMEEVKPFLVKYPFFRYIHTENIKPAQVYEIARRACRGNTVIWFCDDGEVQNNVIGKAYNYWKSQNNEKLILSLQTKESGYGLPQGQLFNMKLHTFFGYNPFTSLMAPIGMMSRKFLADLGGFDRRFVCGQYENFCVKLACQYGAKVEIFGNNEIYVDIDHLGKSLLIGESKKEEDFLNRPFAKGYTIDRQVLEKSWVLPNGQESPVLLDEFEPYENKDLLTKSQSNKGIWD